MAYEQTNGASSDAFDESFRKILGDAESLAVQEVARLRKALEAAKAENEWLRSRLGDGGVAGHAGNPGSQAAADPQREDSKTEKLMPPPRLGTPVSDPDIQGPDLDTPRMPDSVRELYAGSRYTSRTQLRDTGYAVSIVKSPYFEYGTLVAVILNAVWIAIDVDLNGRPLLESPVIYQVVEHCFVVLFTLEMVIRFVAFKKKTAALWDTWFFFDAFLVILMLIETWIFTLFILILGGSGPSALGFVSLLRIMRLLRVTRVVRLCCILPELKTMVEGMIAGIRSVLIAACILITLTYTFAIFLRQLGVSTTWGQKQFFSVPISMYTLLVESILPDHASLLGDIFFETWYCGLIYFVFLLLTAITIMNMLIGILCDVVFRVSQEEKEKSGIEAMVEKLKAILRTIDKDYDGMVSKAEFTSIVANGKAVRALHDVGVDVSALVQDADFLFTDSKKCLPFDEFKDEVLKFRVSSCATNGAVAATRMLMKSSLERIEDRMSRMESFLATQHSTPSC